MLGGKIRYMTTGSAPININVLNFLKIAFGCDICEGYGMSETSGCGTLMCVGDHDERGIVGGPPGNTKIRLKDVPEMGYLSTDSPPRGEICIWS